MLKAVKRNCDISRLDFRILAANTLGLKEMQEYLGLTNPGKVYFGNLDFDREMLRDLRLPPNVESTSFEFCRFAEPESHFLDSVAAQVNELSIRFCDGVNFSDLKPSEKITSVYASNQNCPEDLAELLRLFPNLQRFHLRIQGASAKFIASIRRLTAHRVEVRILMRIPTKLDAEAAEELETLQRDGQYVDYPG